MSGILIKLLITLFIIVPLVIVDSIFKYIAFIYLYGKIIESIFRKKENEILRKVVEVKIEKSEEVSEATLEAIKTYSDLLKKQSFSALTNKIYNSTKKVLPQVFWLSLLMFLITTYTIYFVASKYLSDILPSAFIPIYLLLLNTLIYYKVASQ